MTKWEYKFLPVYGVPYVELETELNALGAERWEFVTWVGDRLLMRRELFTEF